jgi:hypothetical protein
MQSTNNNNVTRELERLLAPLKNKDIVQYNIIQNLIDEVYKDPTIHSAESHSKEIENKLYKMIDDHIRFDNVNSDKSDN